MAGRTINVGDAVRPTGTLEGTAIYQVVEITDTGHAVLVMHTGVGRNHRTEKLDTLAHVGAVELTHRAPALVTDAHLAELVDGLRIEANGIGVEFRRRVVQTLAQGYGFKVEDEIDLDDLEDEAAELGIEVS